MISSLLIGKTQLNPIINYCVIKQVEVAMSKTQQHPNANKQGYVEVFCAYIVKNGKRIYPKSGRFFHFWAKEKAN